MLGVKSDIYKITRIIINYSETLIETGETINEGIQSICLLIIFNEFIMTLNIDIISLLYKCLIT